MAEIKKYDFTLLGGFPLTLDELGNLQDTYYEMCQALASVVDPATPVVLSGMDITVAGPVTSVANGYFLFDGKIYKFTGQSYSGAVVAPDDVCVVIGVITESLTYYDTTVQPVISTADITIQIVDPGTLSDPYFLLADLMSYAEALGRASRGAYSNLYLPGTALGATGATVSGYIYYRKEPLMNALHMIFNLQVNDSYLLPNDETIYQIGTLPSGSRPNETHYFVLPNQDQRIGMNDAGNADLRFFNINIDTSGVIRIGFSKYTYVSVYYRPRGNFYMPLQG